MLLTGKFTVLCIFVFIQMKTSHQSHISQSASTALSQRAATTAGLLNQFLALLRDPHNLDEQDYDVDIYYRRDRQEPEDDEGQSDVEFEYDPEVTDKPNTFIDLTRYTDSKGVGRDSERSSPLNIRQYSAMDATSYTNPDSDEHQLQSELLSKKPDEADYPALQGLLNYPKDPLLAKSKRNPQENNEFSKDYFDPTVIFARQHDGDYSESTLLELEDNRKRMSGGNLPHWHREIVDRARSSDESSGSEDKSESSSSSEESEEKKVKKLFKKPKRFQVIDNEKKKFLSKQYQHNKYVASNSVEQSLETAAFSKESVEVKPKSKKKAKRIVTAGKKEYYLQGSGDFLKLGPASSEEFRKGFRRRLPQFLPKRYHWNEDDIHHLGYLWFDGPKGKYPTPWRINY